MSDVSRPDAVKPLVGVDTVQWRGQHVRRESLFAKLRGDSEVALTWIDAVSYTHLTLPTKA